MPEFETFATQYWLSVCTTYFKYMYMYQHKPLYNLRQGYVYIALLLTVWQEIHLHAHEDLLYSTHVWSHKPCTLSLTILSTLPILYITFSSKYRVLIVVHNFPDCLCVCGKGNIVLAKLKYTRKKVSNEFSLKRLVKWFNDSRCAFNSRTNLLKLRIYKFSNEICGCTYVE